MASARGGRGPAGEEELIALGIDAGGSKVRCVVARAPGRRALGRATVRADANVRRAGIPAALRAALRAARSALRAARASARDVIGVGAGFAGGSDPRDLRALSRGLARAFPRARVEVATDAEVALLGALGGKPGAVVVAGTGSIALGASGRRRARSGGWGPLLDDEGSGFAVGREGLAAALRALDGRGEPTRLSRTLLRSLRVRDAAGLLDLARRGALPPERLALLAPEVARAAERGDAAARRIVRDAGRDLARAAAAVLRRLRLRRAPVALAGGLAPLRPVRAAFRAALRAEAPGARLVEAEAPPEEGALALALRRSGRAR